MMAKSHRKKKWPNTNWSNVVVYGRLGSESATRSLDATLVSSSVMTIESLAASWWRGKP